MEGPQLPTNGGRTDRTLAPRPRTPTPPPRPDAGLGEVARDAIDHARDIVSDSVALGKLEARRIVGRIQRTTREIVPTVAILAAAGVLGLAGVVLGLIAIYIALGDVIASDAVRLAIFAAVFLVVAAIGAFAVRPRARAG